MKKFIFENNDINKWVAVAIAFLAVIAKLILAWGQYATVYPPLAPIDDHLMFTAAQNIVAGNWLGEYGHLTISKHMFFCNVVGFTAYIESTLYGRQYGSVVVCQRRGSCGPEACFKQKLAEVVYVFGAAVQPRNERAVCYKNLS